MADRGARLALAAGALSAVAGVALVLGVLGGPYRAVERSDYMTYQVAASIVRDGDGACLYTLPCQRAAQLALIGEEPSFERGPLPYTSPPWLAIFLLPVAGLPLGVGFALFTALGSAVLAASAWQLSSGSRAARLAGALLVLSAWPTTMAVIRGQASLLVAGLIGLSVAAALRSPPDATRVGLLAGIASLKPTLLPLWALQLLVQRQWSALAIGAGVVAAFAAAAVMLVGIQAVLDYPAWLLGMAGDPSALGVHADQMINWRGMAVRLGLPELPVMVVGAAATLALVAVAWRRGSPAMAAAAAVIATPLVIPHANQHEAILVALGALLAIGAVAPERRPLLAVAGIASAALAWIGPILTPEGAGLLLFLLALGWLILVTFPGRTSLRCPQVSAL